MIHPYIISDWAVYFLVQTIFIISDDFEKHIIYSFLEAFSDIFNQDLENMIDFIIKNVISLPQNTKSQVPEVLLGHTFYEFLGFFGATLRVVSVLCEKW